MGKAFFFSIEWERCRRAAVLSLQAIAHIEVRPLEVLVFVTDRLRLLFWVSDDRMERIPTEMNLFVKDFLTRNSRYHSKATRLHLQK